MNKLPPLYMHKFIFNLEASEDMRLPEYKGSMFRGAFGWSFRNAVCVTKKKDCRGCMLSEQCSYFRIFETEIPDNNVWFLKGVKKVPHPFIIHPPEDNSRNIEKGETIEVGLTIFGDMIKFFPFFVYTFQQMGNLGIGVNRHKFQLKSVYNLNKKGSRFVVFEDASGKLKTEYKKIDANDGEADPDKGEFIIEFVTPARLQKEGRVITDPSKVTLELLTALLERRYYSLSHLFCNTDYSKYPVFMVEGRGQVTDNELYFYNWERYSSRQDKKIELGGFKGKLKVQGDVSFLLPLFLTGEMIHIGKNTIFGLGKYRISINGKDK